MVEERLKQEGKREAALDNPTWTKISSGPHSGEWGARIEGEAAPGDRIEMVRKDGSRSTAVIDEIVWSGRDARSGKTITIAALRQERAPRREPPAKRAPARREEVAPEPVPLKPGAPFVPVEISREPALCPDPARKWSPQQLAIFQETLAGKGHVVVLARAGAGKSTSAEQAIRCVPQTQSVLFTAFAKKIFQEAEVRFKTRPAPNVEVMGINSYGFRVVKRNFPRIPLDRYKAYSLSDQIVGDGSKRGDYGKAAKKALVRTIGMMKETLTYEPAGIDRLMDKYDIDAGADLDLADEGVRGAFIDNAIKLLDASKADTSRIDFNDQIWFPIIMNLPPGRLLYDYVYADEAQDLSPAKLELVLRAVKKNGRIFAIGDDRQCHPPGTMIEVAEGETKPIDKLTKGALVRGWNRNAQRMIGGRRIKIAERAYRGDLYEIEVRGRRVEMTPNHKLLARWTDRTIEHCVVYLMWRKGYGFRVGWCKLFSTAGFHFAYRVRMENADRSWVLKVFESRTDASVYESIVAAKYGIPTATFEPVDGAEHQTEEAIRAIFKSVRDENQERGQRALHDHDREFELPFYPWPGQDKDNPQGRRTYFTVYAANVLPEFMAVPLPDGQNTWAQIEKVRRREYEGSVYSLDVEEDHSYAANGICVLNSIFGFAGADEEAIPHIIERLRAKILKLTISYRCARKIAELARAFVPDFESGKASDGVVEEKSYDQMLREAVPGDFILSRVNAPLVKICMTLLRAGKKAVIAGKEDAIGKALLQLIETAEKKGAKTVIELQAWASKWADREVERLLAKKPPREEEAEMVTDKVGCIDALAQGAGSIREISERIENLFSNEDNETRIVCSSTHKAKGLERERAWVLRNTFMKRPGTQEENLWYVAITRAKEYLFLVDLPARGEE